MLSKCTAKPDSNSKFHRKNATVYTRVRTRNVFFEIKFEETTVARTRVQSVLALGTFTAVS